MPRLNDPYSQIQNRMRDNAKKARGWLAEEGISIPHVAELLRKSDRQVRAELKEKMVMQPDTTAAIELLKEGKIK